MKIRIDAQLVVRSFYRLFGIILILFIADLSHAKKVSKKNIYLQYDDKNKPKVTTIKSEESLQTQSLVDENKTGQKADSQSTPIINVDADTAMGNATKAENNLQVVNQNDNQNEKSNHASGAVNQKEQVITVEKNVDLAVVDSSQLIYVPWRFQFILGSSQVAIKDLESKSKASLLSDVNYSIYTEYFVPINKKNQISLRLDNHIEKYKNFSSQIQLSHVSLFRNDFKLSMHSVIQNELTVRYGYALKQALIAYAINSNFIELQNVPHSAIEFEIKDRLFEYDQINLFAFVGFELHLSTITQDYKLESGSSYYLGAQIKNKKIKNKKIKNPSLIGLSLKQQNANTSFSSQSRTDINFSIGAEF